MMLPFDRRSWLLPAILLLTSCTAVKPAEENNLPEKTVMEETDSEPLRSTATRATPLSFGTQVTPDPATNPITPPERFSGYHAGVDFEVTQEELDAEVPVHAICDGTIVYNGFADGYGGLLIQSCKIAGKDVKVIYGHLAIASLTANESKVTAGQEIGVLGAANSRDTDGNRKHLHLGIHIGKQIVMLGYVQSEEDLQDYINPADVLPETFFESLSPKSVPYWRTATTSRSSASTDAE